ncbi:NADH:flavin oxidoreductase [Nocardia arthritidis]|uniref:NADH:flavin oxidoreductase n=1 Tax=Nocardia arthritidis TaxID=228602 RepID=A0A6G9YQN7_9NOCA|nr:NADH:flavin oxidoreductase [Nocardia arthritidis]QIS15534.1 NADH:flavin oxidoreductase [Nocardia arthritidis]
MGPFGAALLISGNIMIDRTALGEARNVVIDDRTDRRALAEWTRAARMGGAHLWAQLNHPGRQVPRLLGWNSVAPSAVPVPGQRALFATPRALTESEIIALVERFAAAARSAVDNGFTGIEIHSAHGYLISQFLSPLTNLRTDGWGGTPQRRRRFLLEVVRAVRAEIGAAVPLAVKLNSADFQRGGFGEEESLEVVAALGAEGIDLLEISGGTYESAAMMGVGEPRKASTRAREAYFLDYAERVRATTALPLLLTGGFRTAAGMAEAVASGAVDLVGMARPLVLDPEFPARVLADSATVSTVRPRRLGIDSVDGMTELAWYAQQMARIAVNKRPDPERHPLTTLTTYLLGTAADAARGPLRWAAGR